RSGTCSPTRVPYTTLCRTPLLIRHELLADRTFGELARERERLVPCAAARQHENGRRPRARIGDPSARLPREGQRPIAVAGPSQRSEEHTSELQSREKLVCR